MNKQQLAAKLARQSHRSQAEAADAVDSLVYKMLKDLRAAGSKTDKPNPGSPKPKADAPKGKGK